MGRGFLAQRGQKVITKDGAEPNKPLIEVVEEIGKSEETKTVIKPANWSEYVFIAKGWPSPAFHQRHGHR